MSLRKKLHDIIFFAETPAGKWFDIMLILSILGSVFAVMMDSVDPIREQFGKELLIIEWIFTIGFSIEYVLRIWTSNRPLKYIFSFYGIIDLLSILPTYVAFFIPGTQYLTVIRIMRVLRIFRILKLVKYIGESKVLAEGLKASRRKITVFLLAVLAIVTIVGSTMYLIEGPENGFNSIPHSIYWAIVTITTVGYGDISPATPIGQFLAAILMIMGYGIIAVPTGIVTAEMTKVNTNQKSHRECTNCGNDENADNARYCNKCGSPLYKMTD